jgi:hypothetical protein
MNRGGGCPVNVKHLFRLLAFLGVRHAEVRQRLGVSKTAVSLWATGKRPLPTRYQEALFDMATTAFADASAADLAMVPASEAPLREQYFYEQVGQLLDTWAIEVGEAHYLGKIAQHCQTLARYGTDPEKLGAVLHSAAGPQVREAFEEGLRMLKLLDRIYVPSPVEMVRRRMQRHGLPVGNQRAEVQDVQG